LRHRDIQREIVKDIAELHHVTSEEIEACDPVRGFTIVPLDAMP
jgi:hypothetical protein